MTQIARAAVEMRPYRPVDLQALYALDVLCFPAPFRFSRQTMRQAAEADNAISVLGWACAPQVPERLLGFCLGSLEVEAGQKVGYIVTLDVDPAQRRCGLGRALLQRTEDLLRERGAFAVGLHVFVGNDGATRLYAGAGYLRGERVRRFYGRAGDAWVYRKELAGASEAS